MQETTRIIRSTLSPAQSGEPLHAGPVFAAPYHTPGDITDTTYTYARSANPTWTRLEQALAAMESGADTTAHALIFASGIAACHAVFGAVLRPGDVVVMPSNSYYTARNLVREYLAAMGIAVRHAPASSAADPDPITPELLDGARLLWLETPGNPGMEVCDIAALCARAHTAGALVAVDNTTPTALGQKPLVLGADFSVASDTKSMTGHSDLLLGHVAVRDPALLGRLDRWRTLTGAVVGPMEAWLALRSIATLPLRLERSCHNAQRIAELLTTRREVRHILYPGLPAHPGHSLAARQMKYFGPALGFELAGRQAAEAFLSRARLVTEATSFGGICTTAERRARWGGDAVPDGFIRLSAGCEDAGDLLADLAQALDGLPPHGAARP
ncbi:MAG: cystathionine gamma-lyase [Acidobacteriota bacterium]|nr:cystathionine gamma-lyase [Acidobacteriota bacterium]